MSRTLPSSSRSSSGTVELNKVDSFITGSRWALVSQVLESVPVIHTPPARRRDFQCAAEATNRRDEFAARDAPASCPACGNQAVPNHEWRGGLSRRETFRRDGR